MAATKPRPSGTRWWLAAAAIAVVALALWWWTRPRGASDRAVPAAPAAPRTTAPGGATPAPDLAAVGALEPAVPEGVDAEAERAAYNRTMAESYGDNVRGVQKKIDFPLWSRPLTDEDRWHDPEPHKQEQRGPNSADHVLHVWPSKLGYHGDETITVYAMVTDAGKAVEASSITGWIDSDPRLNRPDLELHFTDDGHHLYHATVDLDAATRQKHPGDWGFRVKAMLGDEPIETMNLFTLWNDDVALTGHYRDAIEDGSLVVYVGVRSDAARDLFQTRAELHGPAGQDIGFAWVNQPLPAGESEMRLVYWGKVLHDAGIDGPYQIEHVTFLDPIADRRSPVATGVVHTTAPYHASDFRADAFNKDNAMLNEKLAHYQELAEQAGRGELPLPTEPARPWSPP